MTEQFAITKKLYQLRDANAWDYAVMAAVASFNLPGLNGKTVKTSPLTGEMISLRLQLNDDRNKRNQKRVSSALENLLQQKVIQIEKIQERHGSTYFTFTQSVEKGYSLVSFDEFFKAVEALDKDVERIKAIACYISIIERIYRRGKLVDAANFNWVTEYGKSVNFESLSTIGRKYGMKERSASTSVHQLIEAKVIAAEEVRLNHERGIKKLIFSKYEDRKNLRKYIEEQIKSGQYNIK